MEQPLEQASHGEDKSVIKEIYEWVEPSIYAIVCILLIFTFIARSATVFGSSMVPTLHNGDLLFMQKIGYNNPQRGDVVVIDRTLSDEPPLIKRVIGVAGDVIDIDFSTGEVWRNGELLDEPYINEPTLTERDVDFPAEVPEGTVFVLGDNRNHSLDSRAAEVGMVDLRMVMGRAVFRFFPLQDAGGIQ